MNYIIQFPLISCYLLPHFCFHCYQILVEGSIRSSPIKSIMIFWNPDSHVGILIQIVQYIFTHHKQITVYSNNNVFIIHIFIFNGIKSKNRNVSIISQTIDKNVNQSLDTFLFIFIITVSYCYLISCDLRMQSMSSALTHSTTAPVFFSLSPYSSISEFIFASV